MNFITESRLKTVLQMYNPWWRKPESIKLKSKPYRRSVFSEALKTMECSEPRQFSVLSGKRRIGKTTVLFQVMEELMHKNISPADMLYVSFYNPVINVVTVKEILEVYNKLYPIESSRYLFFDDIQYKDNWEIWLKMLLTVNRNVRLLATVPENFYSPQLNIIDMPFIEYNEYQKFSPFKGSA